MTDLKIEAGKCYETRKGEKATVGFVHPNNHDWPYVGSVEGRSGVFENSRGEISTRTFDPDNAIQATAGILDRIACVGPIPWTEGQGLDGEGSE